MAYSVTPPTDAQDRCRKRRRVATACEVCRRRKERCNGQHPCSRCWERGVAATCRYSSHVAEQPHAPGKVQEWPWSPLQRGIDGDIGDSGQANGHRHSQAANIGPSILFPLSSAQNVTTEITSCASAQSGSAFQQPADPPVASDSPCQSAINSTRMIQDPKGRMMFIGDSANLSFLQIIRRIVSKRLGSCHFVDDPLRYQMVEASPPEPDRGLHNIYDRSAGAAPSRPSIHEAEYLLRRYLLAGSCVLDLYDEADLLPHLREWSQNGDSHSSIAPLLYLVMAVGAQNSHDDQDDKAAAWFAHGRRLATEYYTDDPSLSTVRAFSLITFYLLNAARRNAAFMSLGIAVRAAYALGLHRREVASTCSESEYEARERLWKVIRILDLFMSASLGRPPATSETRNTEPDNSHRYSTSLDLCVVFEKLLIDVYSARMVSTDAIANIGGHHRRWAARFHLGLETDRVPQHGVPGNPDTPTVGMVHVKEAYYWTIMLLTRPFLTESIQLFSESTASAPWSTSQGLEACTTASSNSVLVYACVNSAIRTVELLTPLLNFADTPKRLPVVINCAFISGLVLGLACFGDLDTVIPLQAHLGSIQKFLAHFSCDPVAVRNASIIGHLEDACTAYIKQRSGERFDRQSAAVRSMFGQLHNLRSGAPSRPRSPERTEVAATTSTNASADDSNEADSRTPRSELADGHKGPCRDQAFEENSTDICSFDDDLALSISPYPTMNPHTLWFETLDPGTPLFGTYSHALGDIL